MIYDHSKPHNLADEQLDEAYSDGDRDDAGREIDLMLWNARLQPLADTSELCASAQPHACRSKLAESFLVNFAGAKPAATTSAPVGAADLTVVGGAGHVGIPLVLAFAEAGYRVNVHDTNRDVLATLQSGRLPFIEHGGEDLLAKVLKQNRLIFTSSPAEISRTGPLIITIGTPIDEFLNPVRKVVQDCIDALLPHLADGQLLVLRSTVFPGTTEWLDGYLKRNNRALKVAFCPERTVQGHGIKELRETPQIISGTTPAAEAEAGKLFSAIAPELVVVSPREAELAKLFNNAYRYIEFAAANQFYLIAKAAGLDYRRIYDAMKRNYPRARGIPTPGLAAGPCLMKDTAQLAAFAQNQFSLGNAAMLVNEGLVLHICDDLRRRYDLSRMTVGLLGMAFKAEIDDTRASLSYKFKKVLANLAGAVLTTDPFVTTDAELLALDEVIARSDILILCAPHSAYRDLDFAGKPVVDVWGFLAQGERDLAARHAEFVGTRLATLSEGKEGSHALVDAMAVTKSARALASLWADTFHMKNADGSAHESNP